MRKFEVIIDIYLESNGGRNLPPLKTAINTDDVESLKGMIDDIILDCCRELNSSTGFAEVDITINDKDHRSNAHHEEIFRDVWISSDYNQLFYSEEDYRRYEDVIQQSFH